MLIKGYDYGPLVAGESLPARPGFWSNYLLAMCVDVPGAESPVPEWFGDDGADADALSEILLDPERWPVFRLPSADGSGVVVVYRNMVGDYGIDYLLTHPGRSSAQQIATWEGGFSGAGLTWNELVRIADNPAPAAEGVQEPSARLLLGLPLLHDMHFPDSAQARLSAALTATGAPRTTAPDTAELLITHLRGRAHHDRAWGSPLSGT
ncbi:hypothetical protein [Streptomyces sp. NPDC056452]|uniref:hypothetical protein n=1 Tax=Streptomyces sp. NPDC056452 TaxID=3345821 RepID=UPI003680EC91